MAYDIKYIQDGDFVDDYLNDREDKIEGAFSNTLDTLLKDYKIEWGEVRGNPESGGYISKGIGGFMNEPENAILVCNTKGYSIRRYTVNGYTVPGNGKLLQFYVTKENGTPADGDEVVIQYAVIYK